MAPAAPASDCISAISGVPPHKLSRPLLAHSSQSSAIVLLGVIGNIATVSLTRYATDAAPSFPSIVIRRLVPMSKPSVPSNARSDRCAGEPQQRTGLPGDDQFLVGRNHPGRHAAAGGRNARVRRV